MTRSTFEIRTMEFVREALAEATGRRPSDKSVREAASKIRQALRPVVSPPSLVREASSALNKGPIRRSDS